MALSEDPRPSLTIRLLTRLLAAWGAFLGRHDKAVLVATLIFTFITSVKILFTPQQDDIKTGYTPFGARSRHEIDVYNSFFASSGDPIAVFVFLTAKDGGSMARAAHLRETLQVMELVGTNLTHRGRAFYELCSDFCSVNEPVRHFHNGFLVREMERRQNETANERLNLSFPIMNVLGKDLDLSPNFFGVRSSPLKKNATTSIDYLKLILLQFRADRPVDWTRQDVAAYERLLSNFFHKQYRSDLLTVQALSLTFTSDEIVRTGMTIFPYIAVGFAIMSLFSVVTVFYSASSMGQWTRYRALLAVVGCICPLFATSSALGLLFWFGFRFGTILAVTPFLVLAIGVDDAYLQIHAWQRLNLEDKRQSKAERMADLLVEVGPSISITSLTNFFAFLIGIYTPTPEISLFCAANAVAILFDYLFQGTTAFAGALKFSLRRPPPSHIKQVERKLEKNTCELKCMREKLQVTMFSAVLSIVDGFEMSAREEKRQKNPGAQWDSVDSNEDLTTRLLADYSEWLSSGFTAIFVLIALIAYWFVTLKGALSIRVLLTPDKLVLSDSPLIQMNYLHEVFVLPNYTTVTVFVDRPGDMKEEAQRRRVTSLVESLEAFPESLGRSFSHYWLRDYENFRALSSEEEEALVELDEEAREGSGLAPVTPSPYSHAALKAFLEWPEFQHWNAFIKFDNESRISRFFFTVSFHGENLGLFEERKEMLFRWRAIIDKFPDLQASVFDDNAPFVDQVETILPATLSTSLATLLCMLVVCFLFMYNVFTVVIASLSIVSICIGVFGFLSLWGVDLDPISMATTIMSIGFSVDFPAHITFHYYNTGIVDPSATVRKRIARSLVSIAFPLLQCGLSTILFVLCLLAIDTYMSEVFVKTMVLVVSLGVVHGLIVVPTFLCALSNIYQRFERASSRQSSFSSLLRLFRNGRSGTPSRESSLGKISPVTSIKVLDK